MYIKLRIGLLLLILFVAVSLSDAQCVFYGEHVQGWDSLIPPHESEIIHSVILIGDVKHPAMDHSVINLMKKKLDHFQSGASIIFLGDIVYPRGLPDEDDKDYPAAKADLDVILNTLRGFDGHIVFVPGNHDWDKGRQDGWDHVKNAESYINDFFKKENSLTGSDSSRLTSMNIPSVYLPEGGCPGPVEIPLTDDLVVIAFDSQWLFQKNEKPGSDDCDFEDEAGLFIGIEDMIRRNQGKKIIFAAHHPLFSVGYHGGFFPKSQLLFPLLDLNKSLYIPLPGFLYTGYRKYFGDIQDLAHPEYKNFRKNLLSVLEDYPNIIYAAGHEHNLQFLKHGRLNHIVSGGGGEQTPIARKKKKADFAVGHTGFSVLNFYTNGDAWVEFWIPDGTENGKRVFRQKLFNQPLYKAGKKEQRITFHPFSDSIVHVKLSDRYQRGKFVRFWMGDNYRDVWNQTLALQVFDITHEKGGLEILKRGGGQQTRSVRMKAKDGKQYVLRSVNKTVGKALGEELKNTLAEDAVQDAISASFPFAAITVPKLADAAGVMHTNPKIVWVPDDTALGIYRKDLANNAFLYEERPAGNNEDVASFGYTKKIVSTPDAIKKTEKDHEHHIDQDAVLRARLFDMLINDWDRHDDQWRWADVKENKQHIYRPIPRDRDQVFFVNQGAAMWLVRQNFIMAKFQGFDNKIRNVKGLGFNARYFDRSFITEPGRDAWKSTALSLKESITDEVIHLAISVLPPEVYELSGKQIENKLIARRNSLDLYADQYYRFLSKEVDVVGTNERELFQVHRLENGNTDVQVFALSDKKAKVKQQLYHREFSPAETKEIRLYGLDGKDLFEISGKANTAIKLRLIPGKNEDSVSDQSKIRSLKKSIYIYDRKDKKNDFAKSKETKLKLSKDKAVDDYNRKQYKYDRAFPLINFGYNIDDGVFIGGGTNIKRYNFRDSTFHKISATWAFETSAFSVEYEGLISSFSQSFDLEIRAGASVPRNVDNFFGLGNETQRKPNNRSFYRIRYEYDYINPMLKHTFNKSMSYQLGVFYHYFEVQDTSGRFIANPERSGLDTSDYIVNRFAGVNAAFEVDTRNSRVMPQRGIYWKTEVLGYYGIGDDTRSFVKFKSDLSFYLSLTTDPRIVLALRFGGAANSGDYEFYHANALGGKTNLRGFQSRRFAGDQSFYQNTELRFKLWDLKNYIFNGQSGFYVFNDVGRVWLKNEYSNRWHDGYGFGFWLTPFDFTALTLSYNLSNDDRLVAFSFKYLF